MITFGVLFVDLTVYIHLAFCKVFLSKIKTEIGFPISWLLAPKNR